MAAAEVWIPAVPEPFFLFRSERCECGQKFRGKDRRARYELHWRQEHESAARLSGSHPQHGMSRERAQQIYAAVECGDHRLLPA